MSIRRKSALSSNGPSTSAPRSAKEDASRASLPSPSKRMLCHQRRRRIWSSSWVGKSCSHLKTSAVASACYFFFTSASIQRPLAFPRMRLRPLQAVNLSKALQSVRLGRRVSHPVRSVDQTMLRKIIRLTRCEHPALQKRPITVYPACAACRRQRSQEDPAAQKRVTKQRYTEYSFKTTLQKKTVFNVQGATFVASSTSHRPNLNCTYLSSVTRAPH